MRTRMRNRWRDDRGGAEGVDAAADAGDTDRCGNIVPSKTSCSNDAASVRVNKT